MTYFNEFGQGRVGWKSGAVAPSISYLLDTYSGAAAAYSLRKLRTAYTGNAITVRRSSDNTSQQIGFDVNGNLDTTTLLSFVGAGNGFVSTWFDQSGNSRNATQATAASQPQIVNNGSLLLDLNLKPTIKFDGTNDLFDLSYQWANKTFFSFNVWNSFVVKNRAILSEGRFSSGYLALGARDAGWSNKFYVVRSGQVGFPFTSVATINTVFLTNYYSTDANGSSGTFKFRKNNGSEETTTASGLSTNSSSAIGVSNGSDYLNGNIQEIILYSNDQTANLNGINTNINSFYSIY